MTPFLSPLEDWRCSAASESISKIRTAIFTGEGQLPPITGEQMLCDLRPRPQSNGWRLREADHSSR